MKNIVTRLLKRAYVKWLQFNRNSLTKQEQKKSDTQKMCMSIARSLITHPESKFLMAPLSGKRYIKNAELDLFCILDHGTISITNHVYHYDVVVSERNWERLSKMYDGKVETIRQEYEDQIMSQIEHSLDNIIKKVKSIKDLTQSKITIIS
jgi:ABC-type phosphonate transport system ATPase subunit